MLILGAEHGFWLVYTIKEGSLGVETKTCSDWSVKSDKTKEGSDWLEIVLAQVAVTQCGNQFLKIPSHFFIVPSQHWVLRLVDI